MRTKESNATISSCRAFVFIDLVVVTAVIGLLLSLLLPAIQAAREATRRSQCKNQLREIAFGCLKHEQVRMSFPYGGWSFGWIGDPDQGVGPQQPGSWIYTTGPYLDVEANFNLGAGLPWLEKKVALGQQMTVVVPIFNCPSRREPKALSTLSSSGIPCENGIRPKNADLPRVAAKSDYAINGGNGIGWDGGAGGSGGAPNEDCLHSNGFGQATSGGNYPNCNWHIYPTDMYWKNFNGIGGWRIGARTNQVTDGLSKTVLVGEKFMQPTYYETSCPHPGSQPSKGNAGDNGSMYMGWDIDTARTGMLARDRVADQSSNVSESQFGSAHAEAANFAFCDGSVRSVRYDVEQFHRFVTRNDANPSPL
jgi:prepilin-type processing-associated H-X9-DG protein